MVASGGYMLGLNKVILIGNLGKDPELRYTPGGSAVASFPLATTERWTGKDGQRQERTEWHNIVVWGKPAENVNKYLKKGRSAFVEGRISTRSWDDKDGNKKYRTEIVANSVQFIGSSAPGGSGAESGANNNFSQVAGPDMGSEQSSFDTPAVGEPGAIDEELPF